MANPVFTDTTPSAKAEKVFSLTYISVAARDFSSPQLLALLQSAREYNQSVGITGMLLYREKSFMQILEGNESKVRALFARIAADNRHDHVCILSQLTTTQRDFGDWSMAFRDLNLPDAMRVPGYQDFLNVPFHQIAYWKQPNRSQELMLSFRASLV